MTDTCLVINNHHPNNHAFNNNRPEYAIVGRSRTEDDGYASTQTKLKGQGAKTRGGGGGYDDAANIQSVRTAATASHLKDTKPSFDNGDSAGMLPSSGRTSGALMGPPKASKQVGALIDVMDRAAIQDYTTPAVASCHPALVPLARASVDDLLRAHVTRAELTGDERAFFVGDLSNVHAAVKQWHASPLGDRVELFYAVKCNPSPPVLHLLAQLGCSFDCASLAEIDAVLSLPDGPQSEAPGPERIIFANPCKPASYVRAARSRGVGLMTFDNADELRKVARLYPEASLVLRILTDDSKSLCRLGLKFGSPLEACPGLLRLARELGLNVVGVSFHVGSGSKDCDQFRDAIERARRAFDMAAAEGYQLDLLDVGGGFEAESFADASRVLRESLDVHFPEGSGVRIIAEPGRFLVSSAFTLATSIIARRRALEPNATAIVATAGGDDEPAGADVMFYLNDGVYGSFNCIMFDHQIVHPYPLTLNGGDISAAIPRHPGPATPPNVRLPTDLSVSMGYKDIERASVWGPTCDSIDCVRDLVDLPAGLDVGDWLAFGEMGAYTMCAASRFNGMPLSEVRWTVGDQPEGEEVLELWEK